jgi:hypothetical protein
MTTRDHTPVVLDLVRCREPISGHLSSEAGAVRCFDGWLDLATPRDAAHHEPPALIAEATCDDGPAPSPRATADHPGPQPSRRHWGALVTWLGIGPLVLWWVAPRLGMFPCLVRTALITVLVVAAMTYLVMPGFGGIARAWATLRRPRRSAAAERGRR